MHPFSSKWIHERHRNGWSGHFRLFFSLKIASQDRLQVGGSRCRRADENRIKVVPARRWKQKLASRKAQRRVGHVVSKLLSSLLNINVYVRASAIKRLLPSVLHRYTVYALSRCLMYQSILVTEKQQYKWKVSWNSNKHRNRNYAHQIHNLELNEMALLENTKSGRWN